MYHQVRESTPYKFRPTQMGNCLLWLDADQIAGVAPGAALAQWNDLSGNARHALQAAPASQPTYQVGIQSGKPAVQFNGIAQFMAGPVLPWGATFSVFVVARANAPAATEYVFHNGNGGPQNGVAWPRIPATGETTASCLGVAIVVTADPFGLLANVATLVRDAAPSWNLYRNGALLAITAGAGTVPLAPTVAYGVGARSDGGAGPFAGYIMEIIVLDGAASAGDRRRIEGYLGRKWAIGVV